MAGNMKSGQKLDIKWASMSLQWGRPTGDAFEPWLMRVKAAGYDGVTCFADDLACFLDQPDTLSRMLQRTGMHLAAVDLPLDTPDADYGRLMDLMNAVNCNLLVCIVHGAVHKTPELYKQYADMLNRIGAIAAKRHICAHLHNNSDSIGRNFTDWEHLMPLLDWQHLYLMADTGHVTKDFDEVPHAERAVKFLSDNWDQMHYIELKDYGSTDDLNTVLGEGVCDFSRIFALMKEKGYAGWITIEQNGLPPGRTAEACAEACRAYVRKGLEADA